MRILLSVFVLFFSLLILGFIFRDGIRPYYLEYKEVFSYPESPEGALKKIIQRDLKKEFRPDEYKVITQNENFEIPALGLGDNLAKNYGIQWYKDDTYFLVIVGFDRKKDNKLNGYSLNIVAKDNLSKGKAATEKYLNNVPAVNWEASRTKTDNFYTASISAYYKNNIFSERYIRVTDVSSREKSPIIAYTVKGMPEVSKKFFPDPEKSPKKYVFIHDVTFLISHPRIGSLREVKEFEMENINRALNN